MKIYLRENVDVKKIAPDYFSGVTLLSYDEAETLLTPEDRKCKYKGTQQMWWLRTSTQEYSWVRDENEDFIDYVDKRGKVQARRAGCLAPNIYARPALILSRTGAANLQVGDVFRFGKCTFKVISKKYALCKTAIGQCRFSENYMSSDKNDYEKSDVKKFIGDWFLAAKGMRNDDEIADEMDFGF